MKTKKELKLNHRKMVKAERNVKILLFTAASTTIVFITLITLFIFMETIPVFLNENLRIKILFSQVWAPAYEKYGILPLIVGSIIVVTGALVISVPVGLCTAIYIAEEASESLKDVFKSAIEMFAAIPSVIYGFIGLVTLTPIVAKIFGLSSGKNAFSASIILAIMVLPTIMSLSSEIISSVPKEYREVSFALGASKWQTIKNVILPTAKPGILAAIILAFGRAIGETVAVLMVCGAAGSMPEFPFFFDAVFPMTAAIAMYMGEAPMSGELYRTLFFLGLILFIITFIVNTVADAILKKSKSATSGGIEI